MQSYNIFRPTMASVNHIALRIPAQKRLARVLKAAVSTVARSAGVPRGRADAFASTVARRFAGLAGREGAAERDFRIGLDPAPEGLEVRIAEGAGGRASVLRLGKPRAARRPAARRPSRRRS